MALPGGVRLNGNCGVLRPTGHNPDVVITKRNVGGIAPVIELNHSVSNIILLLANPMTAMYLQSAFLLAIE